MSSWTSGLKSRQADKWVEKLFSVCSSISCSVKLFISYLFVICYQFVICFKSKLDKWFDKWASGQLFLIYYFLFICYLSFVWKVSWSSGLKNRVDKCFEKSICSLQQQQLFSKVIYVLVVIHLLSSDIHLFVIYLLLV